MPDWSTVTAGSRDRDWLARRRGLDDDLGGTLLGLMLYKLDFVVSTSVECSGDQRLRREGGRFGVDAGCPWRELGLSSATIRLGPGWASWPVSGSLPTGTVLAVVWDDCAI